jgi:hypothetical protein
MARIDRRNMLKAMVATAAGAAAASTAGIEKVLAAPVRNTYDPSNPFNSGSAPATSSIRTPLAAGNVAMNVMGQEFKPFDSTDTYSPGGNVGSIQAAGGSLPGYYRASVPLPNGVVVTQILFDLVVNDANPATVWFNSYNPETGAFPNLHSKLVTTTSASIQTIDMGVAPITIDAVNLAWALYWFPGSFGATHQLAGARIAWMLNPGMTLFPNPRRVVNGFLTPFTSGVTYGPFDATKESDGVTPTGIPAGASAAFCAVQSYKPGVLTLYPDGTTDPLIASYSATGNLGTSLNMLYMMVPLSAAGKFKIHSYITGICVVDAWGFVV